MYKKACSLMICKQLGTDSVSARGPQGDFALDKKGLGSQARLCPEDAAWFGESATFWSKTRRIIRECLRPSSPEHKVLSDEELLQQAHRELLEAHNRFSSIEESELIDCAIYSLKAAEIRYDYLIRQIKQQRAARD